MSYSPLRVPGRTPRLGGFALLGACASACAQLPDPPAALDGGVSVGSMDAAAPGSGQAPDAGGGPRVVSARPELDACNQVDLTFEARAPSILVLVDRSTSMWDMGLWDPLKRGVLETVERLQADARFGFLSYTGQRGGTCPELSAVTPLATGNAATIRRAYDAVQKPGFKSETPTAAALAEAAALLAKEPATAPRYIVLVTDGEPDFCDDERVGCARDAVVAEAQAAFAKGIGTFLFSVGGQVDRGHLEDVANAGSGQPVKSRQQCDAARASYAASSGSASFFEPDVTDQGALVAALSGVISGVRGCAFDLQGKIQIDLAAASEGVVELDGERVPYDATNGFRMNSATQLELRGDACTRLRRPDLERVFIDFPCKAVRVL